MFRLVIFLISIGARGVRAICRRRADLVIENLALRQQVTALKIQRPRPMLDDADRAFWVALRGSWPGWAGHLVIVKTETVTKWSRDRFRRYWTKISRHRSASEQSGWRQRREPRNASIIPALEARGTAPKP